MISNDELNKMNSGFKNIFKAIKENSRFIIYRHNSPDFDALGAQYGLARWIKDNFPDKEVHCVGDINSNLIPSIFPEPENLSESDYSKEHVAIVVDVGDTTRISCNHLQLAKLVIKIDHHMAPSPETDYGDIRCVFAKRPAASEILALFALSRPRRYRLSKEAASCFYIGIVGDTNRFLYQDTDGATLRIAADLLDLGIDKDAIYGKMYETDERRISILKFCLNNYRISQGGTLYYIIDKEDLDRLHMTTQEGSLHLSFFRDLNTANSVVSVTYCEATNDYRLSIRSSRLKVWKVAQLFGGGGHDYAAGCHLKSLNDLDKVISALDMLAKEG